MAVEDFMDLILDAHVVAAAIEFFGMITVTSKPTANIDFRRERRVTNLKWKQGRKRGRNRIHQRMVSIIMNAVLWE